MNTQNHMPKRDMVFVVSPRGDDSWPHPSWTCLYHPQTRTPSEGEKHYRIHVQHVASQDPGTWPGIYEQRLAWGAADVSWAARALGHGEACACDQQGALWGLACGLYTEAQ